MPDTPNHNYNAPEKGTEDWHEPLNENWEALDTDVEVRDAEEKLEEYTPTKGSKFLATNTGSVYLGEGDEWRRLGSVRSSTGEPSETVELVAHDASEIQPAIDAISAERAEGNIVGGVVRLLPKAYFPETTIWLKRGVVLKGSREWPQGVNPTVGAYNDIESTQATTLFTSALPEGPAWSIRPENGTHTFRHFNEPNDFEYYRDNDPDKDSEEQWWHDHTHPHLPVVSAFTKQPIFYNDPLEDDHKRYWGDGVGMMNLKIHADKKRYWDPADEPDGSERERHATYFGVYDGFLFEDLEFLHLANIEVTGFDGYTAFYQDIEEVVSRGNHYSGTATDHHGSALVLTRANSGSNRYMRGVWDVKVNGPTPTVQVDNHAVRSKFVSGANIKNTISGEETRFLGSESDYDAGRAPIVDPDRKHDIVTQKDGYVSWDGYQISGPGGTSNYNKIGYRATDSNIRMRDMIIGNVRTGIHGASQSGFSLSDSEIGASEHCVYLTGGFQGSWHNCWFSGATNGITFQGRENADGAWVDVKFDTDVAINEGPNSRHTAHFVRPNFDGASVDSPENCVIIAPIGYKNSHRQTDSFSADGSSTEFSVDHGMDEIPAHVMAMPKNGAARSSWPVSWEADDAQVTFTFEEAPSSDPILSWVAQGASHPDHNKQG